MVILYTKFTKKSMFIEKYVKKICILVNDVKQIYINTQIVLLNLFLSFYAHINSALFSFGVK